MQEYVTRVSKNQTQRPNIQNDTKGNEKLEETGFSWSQASSWGVGRILGANQKSIIQGPNWVPWERYQLKNQNGYQLRDWKWISNPTQVLSPNSPSNEAELPLNQRHLAKTKLEKEETQKPNRSLQNQIQDRENSKNEQNATRRHDKPKSKLKLNSC